MFGRRDRTPNGAGAAESLLDVLGRLPMPDSPASRPWEFSAGAFLSPYLPGPLARAPKLLDRLGALHVGPASIRFDAHGEVAWTNVLEVRTRSLLDVLSDGFVEDLRRRSADLVPPVPGLGKAARWAADKVAELTLSTFLLALPAGAEQGAPDVPAEVVYRDRRDRPQRMTPGLVASALLTLPAVRESVLETARARDVTVVPCDPSVVVAAAGTRSAALAHRRALLTAQLARLRGDGTLPDPPTSPPQT